MIVSSRKIRGLLALAFLAAACVPASSQAIHYQNADGINTTPVSAANPLPVTGSIGGSASVGTNGAASPGSSDQIGSVDGSGNLQPASTSNPIPTSVQSSALPSGAATAANQTTANTSLATIATNSASAIPAGTNVIGKVGIDQTTPGTTNAVQQVPGTSGGLTVTTFEPGASDNHTNLKNGAGQVYSITAFNNSATINYLRLYNAASGFNGCNSATNLVAVYQIPGNTSGAGFILYNGIGIPFSTGISYCVVSAYGQSTTTSATASAIDINIGYK